MFHLLGIVTIVALIQSALSLLGGQFDFYFDHVALLIVLGGTVAVSMISYSAKDCWRMIKSLPALSKTAKDDYAIDAQKIIQAASLSLVNSAHLKGLAQDKEAHEMLRDGADMIIAGLSQDEIRDVLTERIYRERQREEKNVTILRNLAKYPPAFGLVGTVLGLINMMRGMGVNVSSAEVGLKMALALIATLYGLLLANFVLIPFAEHFASKADGEKIRKELLLEGILMICEKRSPLAVQEMMNSYLEKNNKIDLLGLKEAV